MGWRGTLRSLQAAARQAEREAERRNREWAKEEKLALRIAELESAEEEYLEYVKEVEDLITVHTECSPRSNWEAFRTAFPPGVPIRKDNRESLARQHLEEYRPGLKDKILRREETTRKRLEQAVDEGRTLDDKKFEEALRDYEKQKRDFDRRKTIAEGIDEGDVAAFIDAIKEVDSLSKIGGLGSSVSFRFAKWYVEATVRVHSEDRVPSKGKRLLSSGKISVKQIPKGRFYELYQDHICSSVLRVAREVFAILPPVRMVFVHAACDLINTQTGYKDEQTILSVAIPRESLMDLNFEAVDCSDSMANFVHNMNFRRLFWDFSGWRR